MRSKHVTEETPSYFQGRIESYLEVAKAINILQIELTTRMGDLLLGSSSGKVLGHFNRMSSLPGTSTKGGKASRKVALAGSPHSGGAPVKKVGSTKGYWAAMTPEQRAEEIRRRMKVAEKNRKAKKSA